MLRPMLKPLVTSSMVMGDTPVMNMPLQAAAAVSGPVLERGEKVAIEAAAVGEGLVRLFAVIALVSCWRSCRTRQ